MDPSSTPLTIQFVHHRPRLPGVMMPPVAGMQVVIDQFTPGLKRRVTVARAVVVVLGAAGLAFVTERLGLPVTGGLCVFLGALPLLWLGGWAIGMYGTVQKTAKAAREASAGVDWEKALPSQLLAETVTLEIQDLGLRVTRRPEGEAETSELVGWPRVNLNRISPELALIGLEPQFPLQLPASAFPDSAGFDAFCLALQGRVWAAQRR